MHFKFADHHKKLFDERSANEREVRLGRFSNNVFIPGVHEKDFFRLFALIAADLVVTGSLDIVYADQTKVIQMLDRVSHSMVIEYPWELPRQKDIYLRKSTLQHINFENYQCRLSLANETYFQPTPENIQALFPDAQGHIKNPPVHFRAKKRFSGIIKGVRLDMTLSRQGQTIDILVDAPIVYEIEIEQHEGTLPDFEFMVDLVLKTWQESPLLLLTYELSVVRKEYKQLLQTHLFAGCQPVALRRDHLALIQQQSYAVTQKWDGRRALLVITMHGSESTGNVYLFLQNGKILKTDLYAKTSKTCIFDAEYMPKTHVIGVFDALGFHGEDVREKLTLPERLALYGKLEFKQIVSNAGDTSIFSVQLKEYVYTTEALAAMSLSGDGLILTPTQSHYPKKRSWDKQFKWKFNNTVDLLYKNKALYAAENDTDVLYSQTSQESWPDHCILELSPDLTQLIRVRHDKTRPNHISVVRDTIAAHAEHIVREEIVLSDTKKIGTMRSFHNQVKRQMLVAYSGPALCKRLLDLACGRGGDLQKWAHIEYVEGYDKDAASIAEANRRYEESGDGEKKLLRKFHVKDLASAPVLLNRLFDVVTCQFALHYFLINEATFNTFITTVTHNLRHVFMGCCLDGGRVLKTVGWAGHFRNDVCSMTLASQQTASLFGNAIDVQLHDSVLSHGITEYIVDFPALVEYLKQYHLVLIDSHFFDTLPGFDKLTPSEQEYSRLNRTFVFIHEKRITVPVLRDFLRHKKLKQGGQHKQELIDRLKIQP